MSEVTLIPTTTPIDAEEVQVRFTMYFAAIAGKLGEAFGAKGRQSTRPGHLYLGGQAVPAVASFRPEREADTEPRRWATQFYV